MSSLEPRSSSAYLTPIILFETPLHQSALDGSDQSISHAQTHLPCRQGPRWRTDATTPALRPIISCGRNGRRRMGIHHNKRVKIECLLLGHESQFLMVSKRSDLPSSETRETTVADVGFRKNRTFGLLGQIVRFSPDPATQADRRQCPLLGARRRSRYDRDRGA